MNAEKVMTPKPTRSLNLKTLSKIEQRSIVIHNFGHALGMEHEHQRSDFWETAEKFIDIERMKDDDHVKDSITKAGGDTFGTDWFKTKGDVISTIRKFLGIEKRYTEDKTLSKYDPDSIMHFR